MGMEEMKRELDDLNAKISPLESKELDSLRLEIVKMRKEIINATLGKDEALQTLEKLKKEGKHGMNVEHQQRIMH